MAEIVRTRMISPGTRKSTSTSYKINTEGIGKHDTLKVEITHATKNTKWVYVFKGSEISDRKSIHFSLKELSGGVDISWGPMAIHKAPAYSKKPEANGNVKKPAKNVGGINFRAVKKSFPPIVDSQTKILILGTLPGDESLRLQQYYANPRNQFWKLLSGVWNEPVPLQYSEKIVWLQKHRVGIWDVCGSANRKGSLDAHIENIIPNNLRALLKKYSDIKMLLFNGVKSRDAFDSHFTRLPGIFHETLLSSSGAASISFDKKVSQWKENILTLNKVDYE